MLRILIVTLCLPFGAWAASPGEVARLHDILQTDELMDILSEEGLMQSEALRDDMFPGRGGIGWTATVERIYAPERLGALFRSAFDKELETDDVGELLTFYQGDTGAQVATLEVSARRAIMSDEVEEAAIAAYQEIAGSGSAREALLDEFAEINGLVDRNVAGALNANLAFYRGLASGDGFEMDEASMLSDVWSQEEGIRDDTTEWIYGFMAFAYEPLSDDELRTYVDVTATRAGRDLNRALFAGFDAIFADVSFALGAAAADFSSGDEL
ncbi:MAG: hypothetical protein AAF718_05510 [Pseudomonadota bacterium]